MGGGQVSERGAAGAGVRRLPVLPARPMMPRREACARQTSPLAPLGMRGAACPAQAVGPARAKHTRLAGAGRDGGEQAAGGELVVQDLVQLAALHV